MSKFDIDMGPTNSVQRLFFFNLAFIVLSMEKKQNMPVLTSCIVKMSGRKLSYTFYVDRHIFLFGLKRVAVRNMTLAL